MPKFILYDPKHRSSLNFLKHASRLDDAVTKIFGVHPIVSADYFIVPVTSASDSDYQRMGKEVVNFDPSFRSMVTNNSQFLMKV